MRRRFVRPTNKKGHQLVGRGEALCRSCHCHPQSLVKVLTKLQFNKNIEQLPCELDFKFATSVTEDEIRARVMILALMTSILIRFAADRQEHVYETVCRR